MAPFSSKHLKYLNIFFESVKVRIKEIELSKTNKFQDERRGFQAVELFA